MNNWDQTQLWGDDAVSLEVRFSDLCGWEWSLRHRENCRWYALESGTAKSTADALARAADALVELAHTYR